MYFHWFLYNNELCNNYFLNDVITPPPFPFLPTVLSEAAGKRHGKRHACDWLKNGTWGLSNYLWNGFAAWVSFFCPMLFFFVVRVAWHHLYWCWSFEGKRVNWGKEEEVNFRRRRMTKYLKKYEWEHNSHTFRMCS